MNAQSKVVITVACLMAIELGLAWMPRASAQDTMPGMSMQNVQMPSSKSKHPAHTGQGKKVATLTQATASSSGAGHAGLGMSTMHGMPMPAAASSSPPTSTHPTHPMKTQEGAMSDMQVAPTKPATPVEMQHLHFGQMLGTRPRPGGLAGTMGNMPSIQGMDMSTMRGGSAPPDARSPDYSDGYGYGPMPGLGMHDNPPIAMLLLNQLEYVHVRDGGNAVAIDGQAWYGRNFNKLWLKFEGDRSDGQLQELRTEALWDHAVTTYWDTQVGVRHDFGIGPGRTWTAFGIEGLAPYWFDSQATFYVGQGGRTAARVEFEYEELLTQRLILQPRLEANVYGKNDPQRGIGSGLSDVEAGLRLRYEIRREFAPYIGVVWRQRFGRTADFARAQGESADDLQFVAGVRVWF